MKKIFLATNNQGKIERFRELLAHVDPEIETFTPKDLGIEPLDTVEDGKTLLENAEIKARAYFGLVDAPKRAALGETDEHVLTKEEIAEKLLSFWKGIAAKNGGQVDAAWVESFVVLNPDGSMKTADSRREVVLTDQEFGTAHIQFPVRALYYSKATGKPAILHTKEEELIELQPIIDALAEVLN